MIIGIPKEIKEQEHRVAISPSGAELLVRAGHKVIIEAGAGMGSGFTDDVWLACKAEIVKCAKDVWQQADMVLKVKEPLASEYDYLRPGLILFTYLHLAAVPALTEALIKSGVSALAYETIQQDDGSLPLLTPMSEIAGRMSIQVGSQFLEKTHGGSGVLLGGVPGVRPSNVVIIGGGVVGINAARIALGQGAHVTILDINLQRLREIDVLYQGRIDTLASNSYNIASAVSTADLLVGAVLMPGRKAPCLVTADMVKCMTEGSVIVDVAVDQGGSIETIDRVTTHENPIYEKFGILHYAVANMPGAVPRTSTFALTQATILYALKIADKGLKGSILADAALAKGVNVYQGKVTCLPLIDNTNYCYHKIHDII